MRGGSLLDMAASPCPVGLWPAPNGMARGPRALRPLRGLHAAGVLCIVGSRAGGGNGGQAMTDGWVRLSVAGADEVRAWSHGEVTLPDTVQPRMRRPVPRGLFCEHIFGIENYWECHC